MAVRGLRVYLLSNDSAESVAVAVFVNAGTREEVWPQEAGLAHVLEHMNFRGTRKFPTSEMLSGYLEEIGGYKSAWTDREGTCYYGRAPHEYKERIFEVLFEAVQHPLIEDARISTEEENILKEISGKKDNPVRFLQNLTFEFVFLNHPLARDVLGTEKAVAGFKRDDFLKFRKKFYVPANYTVIVTGKIQEKEVEELIEKYFDSNERGIPTIREKIQLERKNERAFSYAQNLNQLYFALVAPFECGDDNMMPISLDLFSRMIGGGVFSPLFQEIREKRGLAYTIRSGVQKFSDFGLFFIQGATDKNRYNEIRRIILDVIKEGSRNERLLEVAKKQKIGQFRLTRENTGNILDFATRQVLEEGKLRDYSEIERDFNDVRISEVATATDKYLSRDSIMEVVLMPSK